MAYSDECVVWSVVWSVLLPATVLRDACAQWGWFKLSECVLFNGKPSARDEFDRLLTLLRLVATETASGRRRGPLFNQPETETTSSQARHRHVGSLQHAPEINRSITQS